MNVSLNTKACSNCDDIYDGLNDLPLCPDCLAKFSGYENIISETKNSSVYEPHPATDGLLKINRFEIF